MDHNELQTIRDAIVLAGLVHVSFDGWVWKSIVAGAVDSGHSADQARAVFPEKIVSALDHFADLADREMIDGLAALNPDEMRVRDKVAEAVMARFAFLAAHKEAERKALQYWMFPSRKPRGLKILWRTCDRIWGYAGDTATDYNRYTKRGLLAGVIASTTLVWLNDDAPDLDKTRIFLERRIGHVLKIGGAFGKILSRIKK